MTDDKVAVFAGTLPEFYDRYLVPLIFAPYAQVVADRAKGLLPRRVLETAAGTGIVTEALSLALPSDVAITATDLNLPMMERGKARPGMERIIWQQADAMKPPFSDSAFDLIVCQFGVMFFPTSRLCSEKILPRPCPRRDLLVRVVGRLGHHGQLADWTAALAVGDMLGRDPHTLLNPGYFDEPTIRADLEAVGFRDVSIDRIARPSRAASARDAAVITVEGSLLRTAIEAADPSRLGEATDAVERVMRAKFGDGPVEGEMTALIVTTTKSR